MTTLAIIGTGIAGMACGHLLHKSFDLTLYERSTEPGGHTHTITVDEDGQAIPIDTGFMVYNEVTYPELTKLFKSLSVETQPTSMSFSVQHRPSGLEFSGSGWNGLFAQRRNILRPPFWKLLSDINRFNQEAPRLLEAPAKEHVTLMQFAQESGFGKDFLDLYLIPMSSAVWSTPADAMLGFPAVTLIRFFKNHGFLGLNTQHPWRTVTGGSRRYLDLLIAPFRDRIRLGHAAVRIRRVDTKVDVIDTTGKSERFDRVILACHADEALALLETPTPVERELLGPFRYQKNKATLHWDEAVMPKSRTAWSSWNYLSDVNRRGLPVASTIYWMNSLQKVSKKKNYFVSINDPGLVNPAKILVTIDFTHPTFSVESIAAQKKLPTLNLNGPISYCGSYFKYGFHEDALQSAIQACGLLSA